MAGVLSVTELFDMAAEAGLKDGEIVREFASFDGTSSKAQVAPHMNLRGVNFYARRQG